MQGSEVTVPDLTDMTQQNAESALTDQKLKVGQIQKMANNRYDSGHVISSTPKKGQSVKSGSTVDLLISTGQKKYKIKDYTDQAYSDVSRTLRQKGLTVKRQYENSDTVAAGLIMDQDIDAGKSVVPSKTTITLTVSSGKPSFALRNLSDYTQQAVQDYAAEAGLTVSFTEEYSNSIQAGLVIRQSPGSGTTMQAGDHISVVLSSGPRETVEKPVAPSSSSVSETTSSSESSSSESSSSSAESSQSSSSSSSSASAATERNAK